VQGHFRDAAAISSFASGCDVLTVEIEHIDADALEAVSRQLGIDVEPTPATVRTIQDKYAQKVHFQAAGVPLGPFADAPNKDALLAVAAEFGYPLMLKSKRWVCATHSAQPWTALCCQMLWHGQLEVHTSVSELGVGGITIQAPALPDVLQTQRCPPKCVMTAHCKAKLAWA
jgi:hypothetical protein